MYYKKKKKVQGTVTNAGARRGSKVDEQGGFETSSKQKSKKGCDQHMREVKKDNIYKLGGKRGSPSQQKEEYSTENNP